MKNTELNHFRLVTFNPQLHTSGPNQIFILSKGNNAGKPLRRPCPNCFTLYTSEELTDTFYWMLYGLFLSKKFKPYIKGSAVPYIRIGDAKIVLNIYLAQNSDRVINETIVQIKKIHTLMQHNEKVQAQLEQLRLALIYRLIR